MDHNQVTLLEDCAKEIENTLYCVPDKPLENFYASDLTPSHKMISNTRFKTFEVTNSAIRSC